MLGETEKNLILMRCSIELSKAKFKKEKLDFSQKLTFYSEWLALKTTNESEQLAKFEDEESIKRMLEQWHKHAKRIDFKSVSTDIQNFRITLEKNLISSLKKEPEALQLKYALELREVIDRAGFYGKEKRALTTPDPQFTKDVEVFIQSCRTKKLDLYKKIFSALKLKSQARALKWLRLSKLPSWLHFGWLGATHKHLSQIKENNPKITFIEDLAKIHLNKVEKVYIEKHRKALFQQWTGHLPDKAFSTKDTRKELFPGKNSAVVSSECPTIRKLF